MKKRLWLSHFALLAGVMLAGALHAQNTADTLTRLLVGRWEVTAYSEQGIQVDKKAAALPQALRVYAHIQPLRAQQYYGYDAYDDYSRRESRAFAHWQERDSAQELRRVAEAIATPYYAVFFADSTLALYNKDAATNLVYFPESRHYAFFPATRSINISLPGGYGIQWQAQVLRLTAERLTLFLPEEAEVVELVRAPFLFP